MSDNESRIRRNRLYLDHPDPSPELVHAVDYLIHPPSRLAPTSAWLRFRDETLIPLMADRPNDQNLPLYAVRAEEVLAWRASIAPEEQFWRVDSL